MSAPIFVDTNVFVYGRDVRDPAKQRRAEDWLDYLWESRRGRVSRQVLHEYYVTVTRKLRPGLSVEEARDDVRALFHWMTPLDPVALIQAAWDLQDRFSLSFWDALIVGAAECTGSAHLLSEDLPGTQQLGGVLVVNPFLVTPGEV